MPLISPGPRFRLLLLSTLFCCSGLGGCASTRTVTATETEPAYDEQHRTFYNAPAISAARTAQAQEVEYAQIPTETLYALLSAEMAGQRQQYDLALAQYLQQAHRTQDPAIAERATRIAQFVRHKDAMLEGLSIWLEIDPDNPSAHQAAIQILMEVGLFEQALPHVVKLHSLTGLSEYDYLAANAGHLTADAQQQLLQQLQQLRQKKPRNTSLWMATGLMLQHLKHYELALADVEQALKINPKLLSAGLQKARILALLNRPDDATAWLRGLQKEYPAHKGIQVLKARILLEQRHIDDAREAFEVLNQNFPDDASILLTLALLNEETGQTEAARENFYQLLANQEYPNEAHFYLGRMADNEGLSDLAIEQYSQVQAGPEFLPAQLRATLLTRDEYGVADAREFLQDQRNLYPNYYVDFVRIEVELLTSEPDLAAAMAVLNDALTEHPDNADLRYTRAMLGERLDQLDLLERDLRHILKLDPNNVNALNALGYTLADRTQRYPEALVLIQKAQQLSPKNPAIIDSLGWTYFKMGQPEQALPWLEQAFAMLPDHEIAAHLGELLWQQGNTQAAIDVWKKGLAQTPNSPLIEDTLQRLNIDASQWPADHPE